MLHNVKKYTCLIYEIQQNVDLCLNHEMLRNADAETMEWYEIIYKLIQASTFRKFFFTFR